MRTLSILAVALVAVSSARADDAAKKVVQKAVEAHGGEKLLLAMKGCETTADLKVTTPGLQYECKAEMLYSLPDKYKNTVTAEKDGDKIVLVQTVIGTKTKTLLNGEEKKQNAKDEAELRESLRTQEIGMIAPLLDAGKYTLKADKDAKVGDSDAAVVLVTAKGMPDTRLFFDKKSGLLVRMQRSVADTEGDKMIDEITDYKDFKKIDGIETPMAMKVLHDGELYMTAKVTKLKYYEKLDDKKFADNERKGL